MLRGFERKKNFLLKWLLNHVEAEAREKERGRKREAYKDDEDEGIEDG